MSTYTRLLYDTEADKKKWVLQIAKCWILKNIVSKSIVNHMLTDNAQGLPSLGFPPARLPPDPDIPQSV